MKKNIQTAKKAVILLSGGLDSATALAIAQEQGYQCFALTIDYHQRNHPEINAARIITAALEVTEHRVVRLEMGKWGGSALTDHSLSIPQEFSKDVPITYVPARNSIFLSTALAWAEVLGAFDIFFGANIIDYSNYPDCRPEFLRAFEQMANLATRAGVEGASFHVHTPLIQLTKAQIIQKGVQLGLDYSLTISCYDPDEVGCACGVCDPCRFRAKGFQDAGVADVTRYARAKSAT